MAVVYTHALTLKRGSHNYEARQMMCIHYAYEVAIFLPVRSP